jgi:hypothetical protein
VLSPQIDTTGHGASVADRRDAAFCIARTRWRWTSVCQLGPATSSPASGFGWPRSAVAPTRAAVWRQRAVQNVWRTGTNRRATMQPFHGLKVIQLGRRLCTAAVRRVGPGFRCAPSRVTPTGAMVTACKRAPLCPAYPFLQLFGAGHFTVDSIRRLGHEPPLSPGLLVHTTFQSRTPIGTFQRRGAQSTSKMRAETTRREAKPKIPCLENTKRQHHLLALWKAATDLAHRTPSLNISTVCYFCLLSRMQ